MVPSRIKSKCEGLDLRKTFKKQRGSHHGMIISIEDRDEAAVAHSSLCKGAAMQSFLVPSLRVLKFSSPSVHQGDSGSPSSLAEHHILNLKEGL